MNYYTAGTQIRLTAEIRAAADNALTDGTLTCSVIPPRGTPESVPVTRDSAGRYSADYTPTVRGLHRYQFVSADPAVASLGQFFVTLAPWAP